MHIWKANIMYYQKKKKKNQLFQYFDVTKRSNFKILKQNLQFSPLQLTFTEILNV